MLDEILKELDKHREVDPETLRRDVGQRWIIERGLIAAATIVLDVADHILTGHFGVYAFIREIVTRGQTLYERPN